MFDGNADGVPLNTLFFAEVHCVNTDLKKNGVKHDQIILCEHIKKSGPEGLSLSTPTETKIWLTLDGPHFIATPPKKTFDFGLLVYSGLPNGSGFISNDWEAKALEFLNGKWQK